LSSGGTAIAAENIEKAFDMTARDREKGQVIVEFTLVALFFFTLLFGIVEFSHLFYTRANLQHALREAGRLMVTGQGFSASNPNARLQLMQQKFCDQLIGTGLSCANINAHFAVTCVGGCAQPGGGPSQTVTVTVNFSKGWFTPLLNNIVGGPVGLTVSTTWKNEPFM
jgi:Flp pilus assembly protein TadG